MTDKRTIIKELKSALVAQFGEDIKDVILFGSRATGKAHRDSDYDVLIILNNDYDWEYRSRITTVVYDLELKYAITTINGWILNLPPKNCNQIFY